jgi:hypothetical protein
MLIALLRRHFGDEASARAQTAKAKGNQNCANLYNKRPKLDPMYKV